MGLRERLVALLAEEEEPGQTTEPQGEGDVPPWATQIIDRLAALEAGISSSDATVDAPEPGTVTPAAPAPATTEQPRPSAGRVEAGAAPPATAVAPRGAFTDEQIEAMSSAELQANLDQIMAQMEAEAR